AVFSGGTATVHNTIPLVTSNKARAARGLPLLTNSDGSPIAFDHLVPQRLAAPVEVLIEQFSGHPLETDVAELYGPPDGYVDSQGVFHSTRQSPADRAVFRVTLAPEDGLYLLPYMALQTDGSAWEGGCTARGAPFEKCRQTFYPDASRLFEEIDRGLGGRSGSGTANVLSSRATFDFYRAVPPGGYTKGLPHQARTDIGEGDIPPESLGEGFFPYTPYRRDPRMEDLAKATNSVQKALDTGEYAGAIWLEGSYNVAETTYWLNLLIDTPLPISGNSSQRAHGTVGNDGDQNIVDSVNYILSGIWADDTGKDHYGAVLLQDEQIFASRQVEKRDARPGGYGPIGGHGGILGTIGPPVTIWFQPTTHHTWNSAVNLNRIPSTVTGVTGTLGKIENVTVRVKDPDGWLRGEAIPKVVMVKYNRYVKDDALSRADEEVEVFARIEKNLRDRPLSGFVAEGITGTIHEPLEKALEVAALSGMPVVRVSRDNEETMVSPNPSNLTVEGSNLSPLKARLLLMAALMRFGSLPAAVDSGNPTPQEKEAVRDKIEQYQEVFSTH
ncbi:MAG: asparaginase domain-containing protein, partial [candidate division NC10 bacterium]